MKAVHFGAGNIGRGFVGLLLHEGGYELVFSDVAAPLVDAINAGFGYLEVRCLGCDTHQTVALDIVRRPKATPVHELERYMRCKDCSQVRGHPYKRSHLVVLRPTKPPTEVTFRSSLVLHVNQHKKSEPRWCDDAVTPRWLI